MPVQLPDDLVVADEGVVEVINPAPVSERRPPSGDRVEVPVHRLAEEQSSVPEEIEAAAAHGVRGAHHLVPDGGQPDVQELGRSLTHRPCEEPPRPHGPKGFDVDGVTRREPVSREQARPVEYLRDLLPASTEQFVQAHAPQASSHRRVLRGAAAGGSSTRNASWRGPSGPRPSVCSQFDVKRTKRPSWDTLARG